MPATDTNSIFSVIAKAATDARPIPEAQVATLLEAYQRYADVCPFKAGDLVTPRKGFGYSGAGLPHVILEVAAEPVRAWKPTGEMSVYSNFFGCRLDVRVANFTSTGEVVTFWQESWCLEPYAAEVQP